MQFHCLLTCHYGRLSLREKCPNTELFLVRMFLYLDWRLNTGKYRPEITLYLDTFHTVCHIILGYVCDQQLTKTTLSKKVLKKMILDTCQKTAFIFNNICEQKDRVSMRALLGLVSANFTMIEWEKVIVDTLVKEGTVKFYVR